MNLARLNHILIPPTRTERDRLRTSRFGRVINPLGQFYFSLTAPGRSLLILWMFIGVAGLDVDTSEVYVLWSLTTGVLVASLLLRPWFRTDGLVVSVSHAPRVAVGAQLKFTLTLTNQSEQHQLGLSVHGPFLPWDGKWQAADLGALSVARGQTARVEMTARFIQRGEHDLDAFLVGVQLPFGLSQGPTLKTAGSRFLVTPLLAHVAAVRRLAHHAKNLQGSTGRSTSADSQELYGVRPYVLGDRVRDLHARTWAKSGTPHVRVYRREQVAQLAIVLALHRRKLSERQLEAGVMLAAGLSAFLLRDGALLEVFVPHGGYEAHGGAKAHGGYKALTVGRGFGTLEQVLELLAGAEPAQSDAASTWRDVLQGVATRLSSFFVITHAGGGWSTPISTWANERACAHRVLEVVDAPAATRAGPGSLAPILGARVRIAAKDILARTPLSL